MDLGQYEQYKFAIADVLRRATPAAADSNAWRTRTGPVFTRLAEDRFNLVLVGRFNRGKSSLVNAILGMDRLPTGIVPLTSVITSISYGSIERVVLHFLHSWLDQEVSLADLPSYVTQKGNPGNARRIEEAEVQLPAEFLRRGFHFVDTPGLGSAIEENTRTTRSYLPEADAFLLVTSFDSPLSQDELQFFRAIASFPRRVFVVLNKQDTVDERQRAEAIDFVRGQLNEMFGEDAPKIFAISALQALAAKQSRDASCLEASGIAALEQELISFLLTEKRSEFLLLMCDRAAELIRSLPPSPPVAAITADLITLSRKIGLDSPRAAHSTAVDAASIGSALQKTRLRPCEVCAAASSALWNFQVNFQYQITCNAVAQRELALRGGLCSFHTWQYEASSSPQGIAEGYPPVLENWASWLQTTASNPARDTLRAQLQAKLPNEASCVLCSARASAEAQTLSTLASRLTLNAGQSLDALSALCLPHLVKLAARLPSEDLIRNLMRRQSALLLRTAEDLRRSAIKRDGARRNLLSDEEEHASTRALALLAQERTLADGSR